VENFDTHSRAPGNETSAVVIGIRQRSESIVLQFEDVVGMVECVTSKYRAGRCKTRNQSCLQDTESL